MKKSCFIFIIILAVSLVSAHQPRIISEENVSVENPEVSQAFYAELEGKPEQYIIEEERFNLFIQILEPDIKGKEARKDFAGEIFENGELIEILEKGKSDWSEFYERFAGDNYFQGPEYEKENAGGRYIIKVFNEDNQGKYVLVVGKKEAFPLKEALNAVISMPKLKRYFEKSPLTSFFNLLGLMLLGLLVVLVLVVWWVVGLVRKRRKG